MAGQQRAGKSGIGFAIEKKLEANYDREEEAGTIMHCVNWIDAVVESESPKCPGQDFKSVSAHLKDGVVLCKVINQLLKADGKPPITFQKKVMSPFVAMTNIENFVNGCVSYGLTKESGFQTTDLWEQRKGPFLNVINCVSSLGFMANSKCYIPAYTGEITKFMDRD